jgi:hypothetical protein
VRRCVNGENASEYSTLYETLNPGDGFPGFKIFFGVASLSGPNASTFPKTIDGTKISIAIENAIWPKIV